MKKSPKAPEFEAASVDRLLKITEVSELTAMARATIYTRIKDGVFPSPVKLGERSVAWKQSDIQAWMNGLSYSSPGDVVSA